MLRRVLFEYAFGRPIRRYRRRRRRLTPFRIVRWIVGKIVATLVVFAILGALILYSFHQGAIDGVVAGDQSVLTLAPLILGRWFELAVAFVVSALAVILPGGDDQDWD